MKHKFTDIHHHILYGMDDGASSPQVMQAMLRKAAEDQITRIIATPHVTPGVRRFDREQYARSLADARAFCESVGLDIELYEGAEILYSPHTCDFLAEGRVPTMAGTDHVLVEFSPDVRYDYLHDALENLLHYGFLPIIAHVERYACLTRHPSRAEKLKAELDVCYQVNCSTLLTNRGLGNQKFVEKLLDWDLVDALGTDAHSPDRRSVHMHEAWRKLKKEFGTAYANELTDGHILFEIPAK